MRTRPATLLIALFLLVDVGLIVLHLAHKALGAPGAVVFDLGVDRSYGEMLVYLKWVWIAVCCGVVWRVRRAPIFLAGTAVCMILLIEDGLLLHERVGWMLDPHISAAFPALAGFPLLSIQVGELLWFVVIGAAMVALCLVGWRRSSRPDRRLAATLAVFFLAFAFLAVGVDTVHSLFPHGSLPDLVLTPIEDGGELLTMTPAAVFAFVLASDSLRDEAHPISAS